MTASKATQRTFITGQLLLDGNGGSPLPSPVVVVEADRILDVYSGSLPGGVDGQVVDLGDAVLMPGMWDAHCHIAGTRSYSAADAFVIPHDLRVLRAAEDCSKMLQAGVTGARDCGSTIALSLARGIREGTIAGPHLWASGRIITQTGGHGDAHYLPIEMVQDSPDSMARLADGPDECRKAVREMLRLGADFIKIATSGGVGSEKTHPLDERYTPVEIAAITDEAHRFGKLVASHAQAAPGVKNALRNGVDTIEHGYYIDDECVALMLDRGTYFVPTIALLNVFKAAVARPLDMPPWRLRKQLELIAVMETSFRHAVESGVRIATGPDYFGAPMRAHGDSPDEPIAMVQYGMSPAAAIVATTKTSAECVGVGKEYGTVEKGKMADVIGLSDNPLQDITLLKHGVRFVMKAGRIYRND
jgi:imidazolonepropionase-like amidohydrolase